MCQIVICGGMRETEETKKVPAGTQIKSMTDKYVFTWSSRWEMCHIPVQRVSESTVAIALTRAKHFFSWWIIDVSPDWGHSPVTNQMQLSNLQNL